MRLQLTGLWRHPDFLKLWAGQTVSLVGSEVTLLALPLTAVLTLGATPAQMGILRAVAFTPALLLGLFAGVWIDRLRRRPILILADLGRAAILASIPLAFMVGVLTMNYLYATAFLVGALTIAFDVAYQAYLPSLVQREHLVEANGKLEGSRSVAGIVGPGLAGALVQLVTAPLAILADALSFIVSVLSLAIIRAPESRPAASGRRGSIWREIGEGLRMTLGHPLLRPSVITSAIFNLFAAILNSLFVLYAICELGFSPLIIGVTFAVASVAGLVTALLAGRVSRRLGVGPSIVIGAFLTAGGWLIPPLVGGPLALTIPLITFGASLGAIGDVLYNVNAVSLRQSITPDHLQGRVSASVRFIIWGLQPIGALVGGFLGQTIGLRFALGVAAAGFVSGFLWALLSPIRSVREPPVAVEKQTASVKTI
jgi:MFS family permease